MQVYGIILGKNGQVEIKLCKKELVDDFFQGNYEKYNSEYHLDLSSNKINDEVYLMKMMPHLILGKENAYFKSAKECNNFLAQHKEIEMITTYGTCLSYY